MKKIALSLSIILCITLSFTACEKKSKSEKNNTSNVEQMQSKFDSIMKETIAIHDDVMPDMILVNEKLTKFEFIKGKIDDQEYEKIIADLQQGTKKMMTWMKEFSNNFERNEINSKIDIQDEEQLELKLNSLKEFKQSAEKMSDHISKSIVNADKILERFEDKSKKEPEELKKQ